MSEEQELAEYIKMHKNELPLKKKPQQDSYSFLRSLGQLFMTIIIIMIKLATTIIVSQVLEELGVTTLIREIIKKCLNAFSH